MPRARVLLTCLPFLLSCGAQSGPGTSAVSADDQDIGCFQELGEDVPGDIPNARLVEINELSGCIGDSQGDPADAFKFEIPGDERRDALYSFEVIPGPKLSLCASLLDPMQKELTRQCSEKPGQPIKMWTVAATGRELRLRLVPTLTLDGTEPYTIRSSYELIEDFDEPNEYLEDATMLTSGEAHEAYFLASAGAAPEELDIYRVDFDKTGGLQFQINNAPAGVTLSVELLDEQGHKIERLVAKGKGASMDTGFTIHKAGTYYLRLSNALGSFIPAKAGSDEPPAYVKTKYSIEVTVE